jgi:hypothetical protein
VRIRENGDRPADLEGEKMSTCCSGGMCVAGGVLTKLNGSEMFTVLGVEMPET